MPYETLFKKILWEKELSYNIISKMTGIPKSTIWNYALGIRKPDLDNALKIVKCLGLDTNILFILFEPSN